MQLYFVRLVCWLPFALKQWTFSSSHPFASWSLSFVFYNQVAILVYCIVHGLPLRYRLMWNKNHKSIKDRDHDSGSWYDQGYDWLDWSCHLPYIFWESEIFLQALITIVCQKGCWYYHQKKSSLSHKTIKNSWNSNENSSLSHEIMRTWGK